MQLSLATVKGIEQGRASGRFNLSGQGLASVPVQVYDLNEPLPPVRGSQSATGDTAWWGQAEPVKIDLSRNTLTLLPDPACLDTLTALDVSHNKLESLPPCIGGLYQLAQLAVNNNNLKVIPALPQSLVLLTAQHNQLTSLPPSLARCSSITKIDVAHNQLQALPEEAMPALQSLTELDLSFNQLQTLPEGLGWLSKLKLLHVVRNKLTRIPDSIANMQSLMELHAGQNCLREIPPALGMCASLRHLSLRDNRIQEVPMQICGLQLYVLDLQGCDLTQLPPQLGRMTSLKSLLLEGNALRTIRRPLITGPISALLTFLASRIPEDPNAAPPQAVQSGNVFGQDANALAADMAHKLAVSNGGGYSAAAHQPPPLRESYQHTPQPTFSNSTQPGSSHSQPYQNSYAPAYSQQGYGQQQQQPHMYQAGPYQQPQHVQAGYQQSQGMYQQGQHTAAGYYQGQGMQGGYQQNHSQPAYNQQGYTQAGYQHAQPGYHHQSQTPAAYNAHAAQPGYQQQGYNTQQYPPQQPNTMHQTQAAPSNRFQAAHSTAPFATEATPPLPAPKPTVGKTALVKEELLLGGMGLKSAPSEVWEAAFSLSKLDLSNNQIDSLPPDGVAQCSLLRTLLLSKAGLSSWPLPSIPNCLQNLRELVLSGNKGISVVPPTAFASCPGLVSLNLSGVLGAGRMDWRALAALTSLQSLDLSFTGIQVHAPLEELLPLAHSLRVLNLSDNRIASLPAAVAKFARLEELTLSNNDLAGLPAELGHLSESLRSLQLDGNPLRSIRRPIIERGTAAVLQYLKERIAG